MAGARAPATQDRVDVPTIPEAIGAARGHDREPSRQAVSFERPRERRLRTMARPARVLMRLRNPCLRFRRRLLGWKVRFTAATPRVDGRTRCRSARCGSDVREARVRHRGEAAAGHGLRGATWRTTVPVHRTPVRVPTLAVAGQPGRHGLPRHRARPDERGAGEVAEALRGVDPRATVRGRPSVRRSGPDATRSRPLWRRADRGGYRTPGGVTTSTADPPDTSPTRLSTHLGATEHITYPQLWTVLWTLRVHAGAVLRMCRVGLRAVGHPTGPTHERKRSPRVAIVDARPGHAVAGEP